MDPFSSSGLPEFPLNLLNTIAHNIYLTHVERAESLLRCIIEIVQIQRIKAHYSGTNSVSGYRISSGNYHVVPDIVPPLRAVALR